MSASTGQIDAEAYNTLKRNAEKWKEDADRAQGSLDQQLKDFQSRFNLVDEAAGDAEVARQKAELEEAKVLYQKLYDEFQAKWGQQT